jgi:tetratricopeptide (TPR) repeat protein
VPAITDRRAPRNADRATRGLRAPAFAAVLALLAGVAQGQLLDDPTLPVTRSSDESFAVYDPRTGDPAYDAVMNFEFDRAESLFEARAAADPEHPGGAFGLGLTNWWRMIAADEVVDPALVERHFQRAIKLSREYSGPHGRRAEALYYSGRAHQLLAALYLIERDTFKAFRTAARSRALLLTCLKENREQHDALIGLGLYDYYADAIPKFFKIVGWLLGVRGDTERGLRELQMAAQNGGNTRAEAAYFLTNVLVNFEGRADEGLSIIRWLVQAFPNNHVFFLEYVNALEALGYYPEAEAIFRDALAAGGRFPGLRSVALMLGRNLYRQARYEEGALVLEEILEAPWRETDPAVPWIIYFAGRCRELMGDHARAEAHYRRAASFKTGGNAADLAEERRKNPESESDQRLRRARGLARRAGGSRDAAAVWGEIAADLDGQRDGGAMSTELAVARFRQALCFEEAGEYDTAEAIYRRIGGDDLGARAALAAVRCRWRAGDAAGARATLDSLASGGDAGLSRKAARFRAVVDAPSCPAGAPGDVGFEVVYRDTEAWRVEAVIDNGGGEAGCEPLRFEDGAWRGRIPAAVPVPRYYFRVDGSRPEPDPLAAWVRGERGIIWSVLLAARAEAGLGAWPGRSAN